MANKPYLYWHIQHLDQIGGTEMVSVDLMNHLIDKFNITCIVTAKIVEQVKYEINPSINIVSLDIPQDVTRMDAYMLKNKKAHKGYKNIGLLFKSFYFFILRKNHYRRVVKSIINTHPGKLIASSADSYMFAPKNVYTIFHFHFNTNNYFTFGNKFLLKCSRKPDEVVFLSKSTMDEIVAKEKPNYKTSFIYNPIRFLGQENLVNHGNKIVFIGRFSEQKNPLFAMEIANYLHILGFNFNLEFIGSGSLEEPMKKYVKEHGLEDFVTISGETNKIKEKLLEKDLLLITSRYEGFVLVKGEANACSVPCLSTYFGDSTVEMFDNGKDGYFLMSNDPKVYANKIIETLSNKEELKLLKKTSFECSQKLSHENIISSWENLLK